MAKVPTLEERKRLDPETWGNPRWRIENLYWIEDERGKVVKFQPNEEQKRFLEEFWYLNVILKARQLGFTTLIDLMILDNCIFEPNITAGIVADTLDNAKKIFAKKIEGPWKRLPEPIRRANPLVNDRMDLFQWANGSSISVGASMRSGTLQFLHVSELGKIAKKHPEKAQEIKAGSFNAVHAGQFIFVESTAEGRGGEFFDLCQVAKSIRDAGRDLTDLDWKMHFYPWWTRKDYRLKAKVVTPKHLREYFDDLEVRRGVKLDSEQRAWYVKKCESAMVGDHETMKQEFPSHEDEPFEAAADAFYFGKVMAEIRRAGHIKTLPIIVDRPVNTFWDVGRDMTSIWFHQYGALEHRFIDFYQNSGEGLEHYLKVLQEKPYLWGTFFVPHDAENKSMVTDTSLVDRLREAMPGVQVRVVPRVPNLGMSIDAGRARLRECWFHEENCADGVRCLENYSKVWNDVTAMWKEEPRHDKYSHGASAYLKFVEGWTAEDASPGGWARRMGEARGWGSTVKRRGRVGDREAGY